MKKMHKVDQQLQNTREMENTESSHHLIQDLKLEKRTVPLQNEPKSNKTGCTKCKQCRRKGHKNTDFQDRWCAFERHMVDMANQAADDDARYAEEQFKCNLDVRDHEDNVKQCSLFSDDTVAAEIRKGNDNVHSWTVNGDDDVNNNDNAQTGEVYKANETELSHVDKTGAFINTESKEAFSALKNRRTVATVRTTEDGLQNAENESEKSETVYSDAEISMAANGYRRDLMERKREKLKERSMSSNSILKKIDKKEVKVSKVKVVKTAQIMEARAKSHHFLWTIPDPGSQKLNWHKPPLTVLVVKKIYDETVLYPFRDLILWLIEVRKMIVFVESNVLEDGILADDNKFQKYRGKLQTFKQDTDDLTDKIDFIICLGGDGTLLHASTLFQQSCPPVMAFHQGSLGFLTPFTFDNFESQVTHVLEGNAPLLLRYRLKCVICKEDSELGKVSRIKNIDSSSCGKSQILVLNEVVVDRGSSSFLCNIDVFVEDRLVTSVQGDGIIISTPTGSTAYAVAAGASMIHPNVPAIMITPICPHSLSFRPIVVPAGVELKIMVSPEARNSAMVSFDGRNRQEINQGDSVRITTAQFPLPAVCAKDQIEDWFDRLAECLHWNVRKTQKMLDSSRNTSDSSLTGSTSANLDVFSEEQAS